MQVILLESVAKLGSVGEEVKVKNGFGRNFLIPQGKALRATNQNRKVFEAKRSEIEKANADKKAAADKIAKKIDVSFPVLIRQAGEDGHLYGSVTSRDVAAELSKSAGSEIEHKTVAIHKPIKSVGIYTLEIDLHADVEVFVNVIVARTEDEAKEQKAEFLNPKTDENEQVFAEEAKEEKAKATEEKADAADTAEEAKEEDAKA